jgi:prophage antirepressor-like protein
MILFLIDLDLLKIIFNEVKHKKLGINMELATATQELFNFDLDKHRLIIDGVTIPLVVTYEEVWFPGKEICKVMEYQRPNKTLLEHIKSKHRTTLAELKKLGPALGPNFFWPFPDYLSYHDGKAVYISEQGVYHLAMKCQLPIGEKFREWLAEDVVPTIRKTGLYKLKESFNSRLELAERENTELKEKVAVMTKSCKTKHTFQLYQCDNEYIFIRVQQRYLKKAMKAVDPNFDLIINEVEVPNAMNILNKVKERLVNQGVSFRARKNRVIVTGMDIPEIVEDMLQEPWV